jgi:hypothetical protein
MTSHSPDPGIPVIPEPTPARSKVERLMPLSAAQRMAFSLSAAIPHAPLPAAVMAVPHAAARRDRDGQAGIALFTAQVRALRAGGFLVAVPVVPQVYAKSLKLIVHAHQWITSGS